MDIKPTNAYKLLGVFHIVLQTYYTSYMHMFRPLLWKDILLKRQNKWGTWWRSCLRHCAASRKVAGSIPDDIFLSAALWSWGWLSLWHKWIPGIFPGGEGWGKGGRCV